VFSFDRIFLAHPRSVGESYLRHWLQAMTISTRLLRGAGAGFLHAFVPCLCKVTASSLVMTMADELARRRRLADTEVNAVDDTSFNATKLRGPRS